VRDLYRRFLGQASNPQDEVFWLKTFSSTDSQEAMLATFLSSPEVMSKFASRANWLQVICRELFGTRPTAEEVEAWLGLMACGVADAKAVAMEIVSSDHTRKRQIADWYRRYLHREASDDQLHLALEQLKAGHPLETVLAQIFASHEYFLRAVNLSALG
jgi:hypothetical protein